MIMFGNGQGHIGRSASVGVVTSRNNNNNEPADKEKIKQALKRLKKFPRGSSGLLPDDVALDEHEEKGYTVFPPITQQRRPQSGSKTFQGTNSSSNGGDSGYGYEEMGDSPGGDALGRDGREQRQQRHDEEEEDEVQEEEEEEATWHLREMLKQRRKNQGNDHPPASTLTL